MYEVFYSLEANAICIFLLCWVIFQSKKGRDLQTRNILFRRAVWSTLAIIALESAEIFCEGRPGRVMLALNQIFSVLYWGMTVVTAYCWFIYTLYYVRGRIRIPRLFKALLVVPVWAFCALAAASPVTHWIFSIDSATNTSSAGRLYFLQVLLTYGYFTSCAWVTLIAALSRRKHAHSRLVLLVSFVALPLLGGILHLFFPEAKVVWQGLSLSELFVFCDFRFALILLDSLTGMNNRRSFDLFVRTLDKDGGRGPVYLFMMDVNLFKHINDQWGHTEGDVALERTALILKDSFRGLDGAYLCRYGGDEFAAVYACPAAEAAAIKRRIQDAFAAHNEASGKPYLLSVSIGYAQLEGKEPGAVEDMMRRADEAMYDEKRAAHKNGISRGNARIPKDK